MDNSKKQLKNIFHQEKEQLVFYNNYRELSHFIGCYYMGYILEDLDSSLRVAFTTNPEWGEEYLNNYVNSCHLWEQAQSFFEYSNSDSLILLWSTVPTLNSLQKDIILRREEVNISSDGISFCKKMNRFREYYYFCPELKQKNFLNHINSNIDLIRKKVQSFRRCSLSTIKQYVSKNIINE